MVLTLLVLLSACSVSSGQLIQPPFSAVCSMTADLFGHSTSNRGLVAVRVVNASGVVTPHYAIGYNFSISRIVIRLNTTTGAIVDTICNGNCPPGNAFQGPTGTVLTEAMQNQLILGEWLVVYETAARPGGELAGRLEYQTGARFGMFEGHHTVPNSGQAWFGIGLTIPGDDSSMKTQFFHNMPPGTADFHSLYVGGPGINGPYLSSNKTRPLGTAPDSPSFSVERDFSREELMTYLFQDLYVAYSSTLHPAVPLVSSGIIRGQLLPLVSANTTKAALLEEESKTVLGDPNATRPLAILLYSLNPTYSTPVGGAAITVRGSGLPTGPDLNLTLDGVDITSTVTEASVRGTSFTFICPGGLSPGDAFVSVRHTKFSDVSVVSSEGGNSLRLTVSKCGGRTYQPAGAQECAECPRSAVCPGGTRLWPKPGYWSDGEASIPQRCPLEVQCLGGSGSPCAESYVGTLCASCQEGHFKDNAKCFPCDETPPVLLFLAILIAFIVFVIIAIFTFSDTMLSNLLGAIGNLQVLAGVGKMVTASIPTFMTEMYNYLTILTFDFSFVRAECESQEAGAFSTLFLVSVLFFVVPVAIVLGGSHALAAMKKNEERSMWHSNRSVRGVFLLALLEYQNVAYVCFSGVTCQRIGQKLHLLADREMECFVGNHLPVFIVSCFVLITFVVPLPIWVAYNLLYKFKLEDLYEERRLARFGVIYEDYRGSKTHYGLLSFGLPFVLAFLAAVLPNESAVQLWISVGVLVAFFIIYVYLQPFKSVYDNFAGAFTVGYALCASFLNVLTQGEPSRMKRTYALYVSYILISACFIVIGLSIYPFLKALKENMDRNKVAPYVDVDNASNGYGMRADNEGEAWAWADDDVKKIK